MRWQEGRQGIPVTWPIGQRSKGDAESYRTLSVSIGYTTVEEIAVTIRKQLQLVDMKRTIAALILTIAAVPAVAEDCGVLSVLGEHAGKILPEESRLTYDAYQRGERAGLEAERARDPNQIPRITKEQLSLDHQNTLIQRTKGPVEEAANIRLSQGERSGREFVDDVRTAIGDSDKGKLKTYQDITWSPKSEAEMARSDAFLDLITLRQTADGKLQQAQTILQQVLVSDFGGRPGEGILSPRLSNQEIRAVVEKNFFLKGALHDLPGIYDAYLEFAATGDAARFTNRLRYNFSHNGPGRNADFQNGFWGGLFNILVPNQLKTNGNERFFEGTIYWSAEGKIRYPEGSSVGWFLHTGTDRMQGEVNLLKFISEVPPSDKIDTLAGSYTANGVFSQLGQLRQRLGEVAPGWNSPQATRLVENHLTSLERAQRDYANAIGARMRFGARTPEANNKVESMQTLNERGEQIAEYRVVRTENFKMTRNGQDITREEFLTFLGQEVFAPVTRLDPLNQ